MNKKANKQILGMTQTQFLILITVGGFLLCIIVSFGGYMIYELNRPIPVAVPPTSMQTLQPTNTSTLVPKATATPKATARPTFTTIPTATFFVIPTISIPTATTIPTIAPTATLMPVPIDVANLSPCEKIIYDNYSFVLKYPANLGCDKRDNSIKSTGSEGFIEITFRQVLSTAKQFCETQIQDSHGLNRFGKNPTMEILQIDNQQACLVLPSYDQPAKYQKASLLVVMYPHSIKNRTLLLISADKNHIRGFISTLRFVR